MILIKGHIIFWTCLLLLSANTFAAPTYDYLIRQPMSLREVGIIHFNRSRKIQYENLENYLEKLKEWNTHIGSKHYQEIPIGTEMYLDIPYSPYIPNLKHAKKLSLGYQREKSHYYSMDLGIGIFQRRLSQKVTEGDLKLEAVQRTPISLDSSFFMSSKENQHQLGLNLKYTHLLPSTTNANKEFPATKEYSLSPFTFFTLSKENKIRAKIGARCQRFVTFNLKEVALGRTIEMIKYDIAYLSGGLSWSYKILGTYSTLDLSYSTSIWNKNDSEVQDLNFSSNIIYLENSYEIQNVIYSVFYEFENSKINEVDSLLTRFGANIRFYLF